MEKKNKERIRYFISKKIDWPLFPPRNVTLTINYLCNQHCIMCGIKNLEFNKEYEIKVEEIKSIIDEMVELDIPDLVLTGGEPFLYEGIFEAIDYAKQNARNVIMITNGFYGDPVVDKIIRSNPGHLQISLDGSTPEIYDAIRGVPGAFNVVTGNIRKFVKNGRSVGLTATIMRQNYRDLLNIALLGQELGCTRLALRPAHVSNADPLKRDFASVPFWIPASELQAFKGVVDELKEFNARTGYLDFPPQVDLLNDYFKNGCLPPLGSCYIGFTRLIISYNEKKSYGIWMCRDMIGDIRKNSLRKIWYGKGARIMRKTIRKCRQFCLFPEMYEPELKDINTLCTAIRETERTAEAERVCQARGHKDALCRQ